MTQFTSLKSRLLTGAATAAACFALGAGVNAAVAQDDDATEEVEEVVITGTRLTKSNISSPVPIMGFNAQEISNRGVARIEDITNILPNVFAAQTAEVANGATGTSTVNLRALGAVRTLVLMDGKRLPFGGGGTAAANADFIPAALVEAVDITTGGGSVQYGSDAVAGVVNFRTKKDYEGFEVNAQYGINQAGNSNEFMQNVLRAARIDDVGADWGGDDYLVSALFGANTSDDRGNVTIFASYQQQHELLGADRDTGACTIGASNSEFSFEGVGCIGSSNFRRFFAPDFSRSVFLEEDGQLVPFVGSPETTYNFGARNHYQRPVERWNVNASARYQITDDIEAYLDAGFMNNNTEAQIAESASFFRPFETNCDNPLLAAGNPNGDPNGTTFFDLLGCQAILDAGGDTTVSFPNSHRNVEGDPRISIFDTTTWRVVSGFRGDINENISFDVFGQYASVRNTDVSINDLSRPRTQQALFVVDDGNGGVQCRDTSGGCVPWNIFQRGPNGESLVTGAATSFIQGNSLTIGQTEQIVLGASLEADLTDYGIKLPTAENGVTGLIGIEYREDSLRSLPDDVAGNVNGVVSGLTGVGGATLPVQGDLAVTEFFAEAELPVIQNMTFVQEFGFTGGIRYSDYSTTGGVDQTNDNQPFSNDFTATSWYVGASWTPIDDIRFRGNFSRAIRAPNVFNLYLTINTGLTDLNTGTNGLFDPCSRDVGIAPAATFEQCARTGVTRAQYDNGIADNPAGQFNLITGGNPGLTPEIADSLTLGVVITPSFVEGLTIAVDYFDINIEEAIGTIPAQQSLDRCLATGDQAFCSLIQRDAAGSLWISNDAPGGGLAGISQQAANIATIETRGIDIEVMYDYDAGDAGEFNFVYNATILDTLTTTPFAGGDSVECVGFFAGQCGLPTPSFRHRALLTWNSPWDLTAALTWRYNGETENFGGADAAGTDLDRFLEARSYIDLALTYPVNETLELRAGVNNLLDTAPPLSTNVGTGTGNNNTYPGFFDVSRFFFVGATVRF